MRHQRVALKAHGGRSRGAAATLLALETLLDPTVGTAESPVQPGRAGNRDYRTRRMLVAGDLLSLLAGLGAWLLLPEHRPGQEALWALITLPLWIALFRAYGVYAAGSRRVGYATVDDIPPLAHAFLLGTVVMSLFLEVSPARMPSASEIVAFVVVAFALALAFRVLVRNLSLRLFGAERVLFVGSGQMTPILVRQMLRQPRYGLEPVAALTRAENELWPLPLADAGALADVDPAAYIIEQGIERVIVSAEGIDDESLFELINICRHLGVKISALPSLASMMGPAATVDHLEGITLIGINTPSLARSSRIFKRAMDIAGALGLLLITAPVWIAAAIAVKLESRGPVLFRQSRIGRGGRPFRVVKFRTMVADAEARRAELLERSRQSEWLDLEDDPRITRVGRFLRMTSMDELPQLWNVLRGDMSLVGPRPLIAEEDKNVNGWARGRLDLTPGITGVWQVMGRTRIPFEQMIMLDYLYVANWSVWTDIKLMLQTVPVVLLRRGAN
jgi:exopolysaccharide biosynthesis polyprenyl glycosylphosphotransferase